MKCVYRVWGNCVALALLGACVCGCAMSEYDTSLGPRGPALGRKYQGVMAGYDVNSTEGSVNGILQAKVVEPAPGLSPMLQIIYRIGEGNAKVASGDVTGSQFTAQSTDGWTFTGALEQLRLVGSFDPHG